MFYGGVQYLSTKTISDEYIDWLTFANADMLSKGNIFCMNLAIKNITSKSPILEIGSFCGLSTNVITYLLSKNNKKTRLLVAINGYLKALKMEKILV